MSDSVRPQKRQPTRLPRPWDSPGKNTGVGCHFLLQCMKVKVKSLSHVRLLATDWTIAYHAPVSMGFSRQEYWSLRQQIKHLGTLVRWREKWIMQIELFYLKNPLCLILGFLVKILKLGDGKERKHGCLFSHSVPGTSAIMVFCNCESWPPVRRKSVSEYALIVNKDAERSFLCSVILKFSLIYCIKT